MEIGIFIDNSNSNWGPGKLALNTIKGLELEKIKYKINDYSKYNLCISGTEFKKKFESNFIDNTIIGPCSINVPSDSINSFNLYTNFLVASEWYKNNWLRFGVDKEKIGVWFGGIDTEKFTPKKNKKYDCLILFKNREIKILENVKKILIELNLKNVILNYGNYDEEQFINLVNQSKFGIVIHNTETQGFAIMEALSMDLPLLVLNYENWGNMYFKATSVPYFNNECGIILNDYDNIDKLKEKIINFNKNINQFNPRNFILKNFTLKNSITNLIHFFKKK